AHQQFVTARLTPRMLAGRWKARVERSARTLSALWSRPLTTKSLGGLPRVPRGLPRVSVVYGVDGPSVGISAAVPMAALPGLHDFKDADDVALQDKARARSQCHGGPAHRQGSPSSPLVDGMKPLRLIRQFGRGASSFV